MRKNAAEVLFSGLRREVLGAMLLHPQKVWYLSQLARHLRAAPSHLHRELAALAEAGILSRRVEGRQTYFQANPICPFLPELAGLLRKLTGAPVVLRKALHSVRSKIQCAFIYGSVARGTEVAESDLDLMVIGDLTISDLLPALRRAERDLGRPVNPTIYAPGELARKFKAGHHFIRSVVNEPAKILVIGSAHDLETIARGEASQAASDQQARTRRPARGRRNKA
jgi:predicted nucleotidyltransferase